jgi:WD40 repeat protein
LAGLGLAVLGCVLAVTAGLWWRDVALVRESRRLADERRSGGAGQQALLVRYREALREARGALADEQAERALEHLEQAPPEMRGWEWGHLRLLAMADGEVGAPRASRRLGSHASSVNAVAISRDGSAIASASDDHTVRLWSAVDGRRRDTLVGHTSRVLAVTFGPDGRRLASASGDVLDARPGQLLVWDVESGRRLMALEGAESALCGVAFSPDGAWLAAGGGQALSRHDDHVRVWDAATGALLHTLAGHENVVGALAFNPDGGTLASGSADETVRLWEVATGESRAVLRGHRSGVLSLAYSPDGRLLASGGGSLLGLGADEIIVWDAERGEMVLRLVGHESPVFALAFSPDGQRLASGSGEVPTPLGFRGPGDTTIRLWELATGEPLLVWNEERSGVWSLAFTPDGRRLVSGDDAGSVTLWFGDPDDAAANQAGW